MKKRYILYALCALAVGIFTAAVLTACRGGEGSATSADSAVTSDDPTGTATEPADSKTTDSGTATETTAPPESETGEQLIVETGHAAEEAGAKTAEVLSASDFGVVGDGVTDDGPAIGEAVRVAAARQATLRFEAGKTYYIGTADNTASVFRSPFAINGASGVTVDGQGATFRMMPGISFFAFVGCEL